MRMIKHRPRQKVPERGVRDQVSVDMQAELENWRAVFGGHVVAGTARRSDDQPTPDNASAERCEVALLAMVQARPIYWRAIELRYKYRRDDSDSSQIMRMSVVTFKKLLDKGYAWLDGRLSA